MKKMKGIEIVDFPRNKIKTVPQELPITAFQRQAIGWGLLVILFLFACVGTFIVKTLANRPSKPLVSLPVVTPAWTAWTLPSPISLATQTLLPTYTPLPTSTTLPTQTPLPTYTPLPTSTALPTQTPLPTYTPLPTSTALPTQTPLPTYTPLPTSTAPPTQTPLPTYTPLPTLTTLTTLPTTSPTSLLNQMAHSLSPVGLVSLLSSSVVIAAAVLGAMVLRGKHESSPVPALPSSPPSLPMPITPNLGLGANSPRTYTPNLVEVYLGGSKNGSSFRTGSGGGSKNGSSSSSGSSGSSGVGEGMRVQFPLPINRPPTAIERKAIRALLATGQSLTAVTRKVYGFKNGRSYGYVQSASRERGDEG